MSYHYTNSGLDDVVLENGYHEHVTSYGPGVSIEDSGDLHEAIGRWLIGRPVPLDGAALRFLRVEMDLTQRDLAGLIGATEQTLRLWEKHRAKDIPGPPDRLLRALFADFVGDARGIGDMLKGFIDLGAKAGSDTCFHHFEGTWSPRVARRVEDQVNA